MNVAIRHRLSVSQDTCVELLNRFDCGGSIFEKAGCTPTRNGSTRGGFNPVLSLQGR